MWIYRVRMLSKRGGHYFGYDYALADDEYNRPQIREFAERNAEAHLRNMEGVTPDMPIEHLGWHRFGIGEQWEEVAQ